MDVKFAVLDPLMRIVPAPEFSPECPQLLGRAGMEREWTASTEDEQLGEGETAVDLTRAAACGTALAPATAHAILASNHFEIVHDE
jgi:hypothetical protein